VGNPPAAVALAAWPLLLVLLLSFLLRGVFSELGILVLVALVVLFSLVALDVLAKSAIEAVFPPTDLSYALHVLQIALLGLLGLMAFAAAAIVLALIPAALALRGPPFFPLLTMLALLAIGCGFTLVLAQWMLDLMGLRDCAQLALPEGCQADGATQGAWTLLAMVSVAAVAVLAIYAFSRELPELMKIGVKLNRPGALPHQPAHQVHPSIEICEAQLAQRVSHMISLTEIRRPYFLHRNLLRLWLRFIDVLGELVFTEGILGSAKGIKFGHWHIVGDGRRLLFCSNFDGAFGGYLDEFIRGASEGVNLVWRHSELRPRRAARHDQPSVAAARFFPPTRASIFKGCSAEQAFKAYARDSMVPHLYRFEAYPFTNDDIERSTRLREALQGTRSALKDDQIARALES
jgi:hypothetical protein